jgi:hypothetical protein
VLSRLAAAALLVAVPAVARAQFAGVIAAPPRQAEEPLLTPRQVDARQDSVRREAMSDMRAWVDSAAGIVTVTPATPAPRTAPRAPGRDSTAAGPARPATPARPPRR